VRRPIGPYSEAVHALLDHLAAVGFTGAPRLLRTEGDTEVLTYLDGEAAYRPGELGTVPVPDWALTDAAMISAAGLMHRFHAAVATFDPTQRRWQRRVPAPWAGTLVTHNDVHPANVIFRDGSAVGLIDFDLAGPGSVAFDVAVAACFWVPILDPCDVLDARRGRTCERLAAFLDGYGAAAPLRAAVVAALPAGTAWIFDIIREAAERGHPVFTQMWQLRREMADRAQHWVRDHHAELLDAAVTALA
jgi:Ser/Thr protein kinase RdoA (MazF antagonist)